MNDFDPTKHLDPDKVVKASEAERATRLAFLEGKLTVLGMVDWKFGEDNEELHDWIHQTRKLILDAKHEVEK